MGNGDVDSIDTTPAYYDVSYTLEKAFTRQLYTYASVPNFAGQINPVPDLATAMPDVSANKTVYTIHLRPDAMWDTNPPGR